jgi:SagB-type dehydrogenase family enzyme
MTCRKQGHLADVICASMSDKLVWVLSPIALAGAIVAVLALRGRLPSRAVLNVWFSLLLMVYVLATAGLGIFWVANQHLPVFDWHYVFGYSMLVLLTLHLAFNFRGVWQYFARWRRGAARPVAAATAGATRRRPLIGALGLIGVAAASGVAYVIGLRHGRTELRVVAGAGATSGEAALAVVEQFHAFSSHSRAGLLRRAASVDWGGPPPPFKAYANGRTMALPPPLRAARAAATLDVPVLGTLLWCTAGVNLTRGGILFRTSPSSGALFATEVYVAAGDAAGVPRGVWNYHGGEHALQAVPAGELQALLPSGASAALWFTAIFRRSGHKYGDRTYRYVLADLGHALENLRAAAAALGFALELSPAFDEARAARALGVDEAEEGVLALALLWPRGATRPAQPRDDGARAWAAPAAATASAPLGVTDAVHRATSLRTAVTAAAREAPPPREALAVHALPRVPTTATDALRTIAARRSQRRFAAGAALGQEQLAAALSAMAPPSPPLSSAVRIDVVTHAVAGLPPAAWRYDPAAHALQQRVLHDDGNVRQRSRAAALDQDVIGDAAAVIVLSIDRAAFAGDAQGPARGYRHAFLEAGLAGERLYLGAGARGLGVCAVGAFYDDEATALVGADAQREWVVHLAALGVLPAGRGLVP